MTGLAPSPALARGVFKGTYGAERLKSKKLVVGCATNNFPTWAGSLGSVVVTITCYKKGKISGTVAGSLTDILATTTTIEGRATFVGKCTVQ